MGIETSRREKNRAKKGKIIHKRKANGQTESTNRNKANWTGKMSYKSLNKWNNKNENRNIFPFCRACMCVWVCLCRTQCIIVVWENTNRIKRKAPAWDLCIPVWGMYSAGRVRGDKAKGEYWMGKPKNKYHSTYVSKFLGFTFFPMFKWWSRWSCLDAHFSFIDSPRRNNMRSL